MKPLVLQEVVLDVLEQRLLPMLVAKCLHKCPGISSWTFSEDTGTPSLTHSHREGHRGEDVVDVRGSGSGEVA